jgi:hypothetical protein
LLWRVANAISDSVVIGLTAAGCLGIAALFLYTIRLRIGPLQSELERLERFDASGNANA